MKLYRLKTEAFPFFKEDLATSILSWDTWMGLQVNPEAIEEVQEVYLSYGHETSDSHNTLCGWSNMDNAKHPGSKFHFTLNFPSMKMEEYDKFHKGHVIRKLMNNLQFEVNRFFLEFTEQ